MAGIASSDMIPRSGMGQGFERYFHAERSEEKRAQSERQGKYHVPEPPAPAGTEDKSLSPSQKI